MGEKSRFCGKDLRKIVVNLAKFAYNNNMENNRSNDEKQPCTRTPQENKFPAGQASSVQDKAWWQPAIAIFVQVTGWIAVPIIIALYAGRWLDMRYESEPWLFLITMGVAFAISSIGIVKITLSYIKKIEKEAMEKRDADNADNHG